MFGVLPAHGLYVRLARGVRIDGLSLKTDTPDARPPTVIENSRDVQIKRLIASGTARVQDSEAVGIERG